MKLGGVHHITMITGEAQRNVDFYAGLLGLRLVKKTVNFDQPDAYHLYFGDEIGTPGSILTWFEFPGATRGRAGAGMIHTIQLAVAAEPALDFWAARLDRNGYPSERVTATLGPGTEVAALRLSDYDGLQLELVAIGADHQPPLRAVDPEIPAAHAILGIEGARAYSLDPGGEAPLLTDTLGFEKLADGEYVLHGERRHVHWAYDRAGDGAASRGLQGAGTVHHIAFASPDEDHLSWQAQVRRAGAHVTDVRDRDYFKSIYFREPRGILFEIATLSPGFAVDEDPGRLGEELCLPKQHEHLREHLERTLRPVVNPRTAASALHDRAQRRGRCADVRRCTIEPTGLARGVSHSRCGIQHAWRRRVRRRLRFYSACRCSRLCPRTT
jgi:glyoxalase family protein